MNRNMRKAKHVIKLSFVCLVVTIFQKQALASQLHYTTALDLPYSEVDGKVLTLNAFYPSQSKQPVPVIIDIHGGWFIGGEPMTSIPTYFKEQEIAVFSIRYRLGEEGGFPENIRDCRNAVRYIRKNAARFNIDPDRIGCMGGSAGGYLSLMLAMAPDDFQDGGPTAGLENISAKVNSCFSYIAPTDMYRFWLQGPSDEIRNPDGTISFRSVDARIENDVRPRFRMLFHQVVPNNAKNIAWYKYLSPIHHIRKDICPILICDGDVDQIVPGLHGKLFYEKMKQQGNDVTYWMTENGGHSYPSGEGFDQIFHAFITRTLGLHVK